MIPNIYRTCEEDLGGGYTVAPSISDWASPSSTRWRNSACLPRASKLSEGGHRVCFKAGLVCSVRQPTERACLQSPSVQLAYGRALRALAIDNRSLGKPSCVGFCEGTPQTTRRTCTIHSSISNGQRAIITADTLNHRNLDGAPISKAGIDASFGGQTRIVIQNNNF